MKVAKYQGCGNDFIIIDEDEIKQMDYKEVACRVCDRNYSIGGDGCIIVRQKPLTMLFYNCDGSVASMCGNGLRCFVHYVYQNQMVDHSKFKVVTAAGEYEVEIVSTNPFLVAIQMKEVEVLPEKLNIIAKKPLLQVPILNSKYTMDVCWIATLHAVVEVDCMNRSYLKNIAKQVQALPYFPNSVNVDFIQVKQLDLIQILTYERGVGFTNACGSGCCAGAWSAGLHYPIKSCVKMQMQYDSLFVNRLKKNCFTLIGPSTEICTNIRLQFHSLKKQKINF